MDYCLPIRQTASQHSPTTSLLHLPPEILIQILSHLPQETLALTLPLVSRSWLFMLYNTPDFWHTVTLHSVSTFLEQLGQPRFSAIRRLGASWSGITDAHLLDMFDKHSLGDSLTELDLTVCRDVTDLGVLVIATCCARLSRLVLTSCESISEISDLGCLGGLRELVLAHCEMVNDCSIEALLSSDRVCASLCKLDVNGCWRITNHGVSLIASWLRGLTFLSLDGQGVTDSPVISVIQNLRCLETLSISFSSDLTDETLVALSVDPPPNLANLRFRKGSLFTSCGIRTFFQSLSRRAHPLARLDLSECTQLDDQAFHGDQVFIFPLLCYLNLEWCWGVTDTGIYALLQQPSRYLGTLLATGLDEVTLAGLGRASIPALRYLKLLSCRYLDADAIREVTRTNKKLFVVDYYGDVWRAGGKVGVLETDAVWTEWTPSSVIEDDTERAPDMKAEKLVPNTAKLPIFLGQIPKFFDGL